MNINEIYNPKHGTLAERLDFAWQFYCSESGDIDNKKKALLFLSYALDLDIPQGQQQLNSTLKKLMEDRDQQKGKNPEYIPGLAPAFINLKPDQRVLSRTSDFRVSDNEEIQRAFRDDELLDVNKRSKSLDSTHNTRFLNAKDRANFRLHIHKGKFYQQGNLFDGTGHVSHSKNGYVAYTLNANGELSVFDHHGMVDRYAHSSMNAGAPVVAAGELKIENGKLVGITTHSGHYKPSLFTVYRTLQHFSNHGIDLSETKVYTFKEPPTNVCKNSGLFYFSGFSYMYESDATSLYQGIGKMLDENIANISTEVDSYRHGGLLTSLYTLFGNSTLTKARGELAQTFMQELEELKLKIEKSDNPTEIKKQLDDLKNKVDEMKGENNTLSSEHGKKENSGRLGTRLVKLEQSLHELTKRFESSEYVSNEARSEMKSSS